MERRIVGLDDVLMSPRSLKLRNSAESHREAHLPRAEPLASASSGSAGSGDAGRPDSLSSVENVLESGDHFVNVLMRVVPRPDEGSLHFAHHAVSTVLTAAASPRQRTHPGVRSPKVIDHPSPMQSSSD
jgi:hypothetical protein